VARPGPRAPAGAASSSIPSAQGSAGTEGPADTAAADDERLSELPGLDVSADSFILRGHALGRLELKAANRGESWRLEHLGIASPDGTLSGTGRVAGPA
jgi:uncharacterized protein YhdP